MEATIHTTTVLHGKRLSNGLQEAALCSYLLGKASVGTSCPTQAFPRYLRPVQKDRIAQRVNINHQPVGTYGEQEEEKTGPDKATKNGHLGISRKVVFENLHYGECNRSQGKRGDA